MKKQFVFYSLMLLIFGAGVWGILHIGNQIHAVESAQHIPDPATEIEGISLPLEAGEDLIGLRMAMTQFFKNLKHPVGLMLLQILLVVLTSVILGQIFRAMGQPTVIGEILAGIILGPSFFGWIFSDAYHFVFPASSLNTLQLLSRIGVLLFMFVVGMELDIDTLKKRSHSAVVVSHASIVTPFFLGMLLSLYLFEKYALANVSFSEFSLFMGIAMSITAFPVLARILNERNLFGTPLGTMSLAAAAVDDVTAWSLLAVIVGMVEASSGVVGIYALFFAVLFVVIMLFFVRPLVATLLLGDDERHRLNHNQSLVLVIILIFSSALYTRCIGIHSLFGAFLAGVIIPPNPALKHFLRQRLEHVTSIFLLPLFFAYTGLRTQMGLLGEAGSVTDCLLIILVAVAGKMGGSAVAARVSGMPWPESLALGALMNTRGLMELVVLNIGLDLGILSPRIFAMMVLMALVTTFMTVPLISTIQSLSKKSFA